MSTSPFPTINTQLPKPVVDARNAANEAATSFGQVSADAPRIEDVLRQKIINAYNNNQDIVAPLDQATATYLGSPQAAREKYQDVFNPFQRESLVSQYVSNSSLPMLSYSNILGNRQGRIDDTIGAGVRGFESYITALQAKAQNARQVYQDMLSDYTLGEDMKQRQFENNLALMKLKQSGSGGSGTGIEGVTKADQMTAETWGELQYDDIADKQRSADDIANIIRRDENALRMAGVNVDALWEWQRKMKEQEVLSQPLPEPEKNQTNWTNTIKSGLMKLIEPYNVNGTTFPKYL